MRVYGTDPWSINAPAIEGINPEPKNLEKNF